MKLAEALSIRADLVVITPQELVAGLLWEITYFGGTEEIFFSCSYLFVEECRKNVG